MRFHSKYHLRNHHTLSSSGYPDSASDPIASPDNPFQGDFIMTGTLSCETATFTEGLSSLTILDTIVSLSVGTLTLTSGFATNTDGSNLINVDAETLDGIDSTSFELTSNKNTNGGYLGIDSSGNAGKDLVNLNVTTLNSEAIGNYLITSDLSSTVAPLVTSNNDYGYELPEEFFPEELSSISITSLNVNDLDVSTINNTSVDDFLRSQQLSSTVAPLVTSNNDYGYELPVEFIPEDSRNRYVGFYDYNASNALSSVTLTSGQWTKIENDGEGENSLSSYRPNGMGAVWDVSNNVFDWDVSGLSLGDMIDIRLDIEVTTSTTNEEVEVDLVLAVGTPSEYRINFLPKFNIATAQTIRIKEYNGIYIGNNDTLTSDGYFEIRPTGGGSFEMKVNGFYVKIIRRAF